MSKSYQKPANKEETNEIPDALEAYVREGARQMLATVLEEEVNAFLGRHRSGRSAQFRGYLNGYHPARELTVGMGPVVEMHSPIHWSRDQTTGANFFPDTRYHCITTHKDMCLSYRISPGLEFWRSFSQYLLEPGLFLSNT